MLRRVFLLVLLLAGATFATREWTEQEFEQFHRTYKPQWIPRPESLIHGPRRYNYLERIKLMCDFVAAYQVADSLSPDFGGIIEAEHMPGVVETDNTQEAIWVWSRWYELTHRNDYQENIDRAWIYVLNFPAYWEHNGNPTSIWYAVWNCGLAFMAETQYRHAYADSSFMAYADSCRGFYLCNPLEPWGYRDNFVTGQSSGMAYDYALEMNDHQLRDSALARGERVKAWIEEDAQDRLGYASWAMSGGTAMWGVCKTVCTEDTVAGRQWIETYAESLPGFFPTGTWNCSHNIWLANAYRACAQVGHDTNWWLIHHYLVDTLLRKDTDRDGGIPATWTDPETQDQTWISTYLDFMGMDVFVTPTFDHDVAALEFTSPNPHGLYIAGDTIDVRVPVANHGLNDETWVHVDVSGPGYNERVTLPALDFLAIDTLAFPGLPAPNPGMYQLDAITAATGDQNPLNDTSHTRFKVYGTWTITGTLLDSATGGPIHAWLKAGIKGDSAVWDSAETDRSGNFALHIIDTTITIALEPFPPYFKRTWEFTISGDTSINLVTQPAHLMLVNNDSLEQYEQYYTSTLDTLELTWFVWPRPRAGPPPWHLMDRLRTPTIIWYSGDSRSNTVPERDQDSIAHLAQDGINLLLTGQNIAEELAGSLFLESLVGSRFDSSGYSRFFVFGNRADSLGALLGATATAGGNGANNQNSRDMISPLTRSSILMLYDTLSGPAAATRRYTAETGTRVVFLGFGFEAVNRPQSRPDFLTRVELMDKLLSWFGLATGIEQERRPRTAPGQPLTAYPNPFRFACHIKARAGANVELFDPAGRRIAVLQTGESTWRPEPACAPGLYFIRASTPRHTAFTRIIYLK